MKNLKVRHIAAAVGLAGAMMAGHAVEIYKYVMPNGTVLYSQNALEGRKPVKVLHVEPPDAKQRKAQRQARRELERLRVRADELGGVGTVSAANVSGDTCTVDTESPQAMHTALTPLPGERMGLANGGTRLTDGYWERVHMMLRPCFQSKEQMEQAVNAASINTATVTIE